MQRDSSTYCDEPPDAADYAAWRGASFDLAAHEPRIAALLAANALVRELEERLVPLLVERDEFWSRYFYRWGGAEGDSVLRCWAAGRIFIAALATRLRQGAISRLGAWMRLFGSAGAGRVSRADSVASAGARRMGTRTPCLSVAGWGRGRPQCSERSGSKDSGAMSPCCGYRCPSGTLPDSPFAHHT
jgi:hypothetical protein